MKAKAENELRLDCLRMKREIQREIAAETRGMTPGERLAHYRKLAAASPFAARVRARSRRKNGNVSGGR
jgi:hypothetical protein